jgi:hypothetical protein
MDLRNLGEERIDFIVEIGGKRLQSQLATFGTDVAGWEQSGSTLLADLTG